MICCVTQIFLFVVIVVVFFPFVAMSIPTTVGSYEQQMWLPTCVKQYLKCRSACFCFASPFWLLPVFTIQDLIQWLQIHINSLFNMLN